ncbi:hypothetical protein Tco_1084302 [Tanacetum coccineum]
MTRRKDTKIPQSSVPSDNVANKAVNEEMDDSLERAVTTATSLDVKQDRGSGPRCQNTIGDTIAQTRSENVSKQSNDSLLARVNTPRSDEDSLKLQELIELCTNLQKKVLDFETTNSSKYDCMFEKKARVESSSEEDLGKEDASKQGRIADIDNNEDITLVSTHFDADTDMFGVHDLDGEEVFVESEAPMVNAATITSTILVSAATITEVDITLAQALAELTKAKVKADYQLAQRLQVEKQEELTVKEKAKLFQQLLEKRRKHFAAKRVEEERKKPPTKAQQRIIMCTYLKNMDRWKPKDLKNKSFANIQELFDKAIKRVNTFFDFRTELVEGSSKRACTELEQEVTKKQKVDDRETSKVDDDQEAAKIKVLKEIVFDEEEVAVNAIPLATKPPTIVDWKILKEGKISYFQIIRADGSSMRYSAFIQMHKSFDREDLETL